MKNLKWFMTSLLCLLTSLLIGVKFVFAELQIGENGVILVTEENTYDKTKYYRQNPFGIIGGFHLVGFNSVETSAHTNGNILTNLLKYGVNFGTNNYEEINYARQIETNGIVICGGDGAGLESILVVGSDVSIGETDGGNAWLINGNKLDRPRRKEDNEFAGKLWQDSETTKFVDIEEEQRRAVSINQQLRNYDKNNINTIGHFEDQNNYHIEIRNKQGVNVYNIIATEARDRGVDFNHQIECTGFEHEKNASLVINVDLNGWTDGQGEKIFTIPKSLIKYGDNDYAPTSEVTSWPEANVVWNFYDSSETDGCYKGEIRNGGVITGIILAPKAKVVIYHNLNGSIIANDVVISGGESHRTDFTGDTLDPYENQTSIEVEIESEDEELPAVKITLLADGEETGETVELNEENDWSHVFAGLPKKDDQTGEDINYSIKVDEEGLDNYSEGIKSEDSKRIIKIKKQAKIGISVEKIWYGKENLDSVRIFLYANGTKIMEGLLKKSDGWNYTFNDLDKYKDAEEIEYDIQEDSVQGYESNISGNQKDGFIIKNISNEKTNVMVKKEFVGNKTDDVTINLLGDNQNLKSIKLSPINNWEYTFENLDRYDKTDGHEIIYDVSEVAIPGYDIVKTVNPDKKFVFKNIETKKEDSSPGSDTDSNSDGNETNENISFKLIDDNKDSDKNITVIYPEEKKFETGNIYAINPESNFDSGFMSLEDNNNNNNNKDESYEENENINLDPKSDEKEIKNEGELNKKFESENDTEELPKTGDGINIDSYLKMIFVLGVLLFLIGLFKRLGKKYN